MNLNISDKIGLSELIVNPDGSVFHLHLKPEQIADDIILVGDPGRVRTVADFFEQTETEVQNREFHTVTGIFQGKRITVISTGIGTDNIDIVLNEIDALSSIDLNSRKVKPEIKSLNLFRIGTSGALQTDIPVFSWLVSRKSVGFDNLIHFYDHPAGFSDNSFLEAFKKHAQWNPSVAKPYLAECDPGLFDKIFDSRFVEGITISAPGFYGPQGRSLRLRNADPDLNSKIESFTFEGKRITNFEMECSALYGLSTLFGHRALTVCLIISNRIANNFNGVYKEKMRNLIYEILVKIAQ